MFVIQERWLFFLEAMINKSSHAFINLYNYFIWQRSGWYILKLTV